MTDKSIFGDSDEQRAVAMQKMVEENRRLRHVLDRIGRETLLTHEQAKQEARTALGISEYF